MECQNFPFLSDKLEMIYMGSILDKAINSELCEINKVEGSHLEIIQLPQVSKTAGRMEQIISSKQMELI